MPTTGQSVLVNANMTLSGVEKETYKEMGRLLALGEVTTRNSVMNPVPKPIDDKDVACYIVHYKMGRAVYGFNKHDLCTMQYLRDNSVIIPDH